MMHQSRARRKGPQNRQKYRTLVSAHIRDHSTPVEAFHLHHKYSHDTIKNYLLSFRRYQK